MAFNNSLPRPPSKWVETDPATRAGQLTQAALLYMDAIDRIAKALASATAPAPAGASYVTMATDAGLSAERTLAVSAALSLVDGGANNPVTLGRPALTGDVTAAANSNALKLVQASDAFQWNGILSPAQITANQNDYSPTGIANANVLRLTSNASITITGIAASPNSSGRILKIFNCNAVGSGLNISFDGTSVASAAANRFIGLIFSVAPGRFVELWYDPVVSLWRFCL